MAVEKDAFFLTDSLGDSWTDADIGPPLAGPSEKSLREEAILLVEALIFASAAPVKPGALTAFLTERGFAPEAARLSDVLEALAARYENHAMTLHKVSGGWQLRTRPAFGPALARIVEKPRRLGRAAMETLAVVAYHQPCTRAEIETIRGVSLAQGTLDVLLEEGLLAPRGRKEVPGRPVLWGTTPAFLRLFGLASLSDLPSRGELVLDGASEARETVKAPSLETTAPEAGEPATGMKEEEADV